VADTIQGMLDYAREELPIKYLDMPLSTRKLDKSEWHLLIEKIERKHAAWIAG
jgi:hypothetical protein